MAPSKIDQYLALTPQATTRGPSVAADTGTAIHRAVELWHRGSHSAGALAAVGLKRDLAEDVYSAADMKRVELAFQGYVDDERNEPQSVLTSAMEMTVNLVLEVPTEYMFDGVPISRSPIHLVGHIDQLRFTDDLGNDRLSGGHAERQDRAVEHAEGNEVPELHVAGDDDGG